MTKWSLQCEPSSLTSRTALLRRKLCIVPHCTTSPFTFFVVFNQWLCSWGMLNFNDFHRTWSPNGIWQLFNLCLLCEIPLKLQFALCSSSSSLVPIVVVHLLHQFQMLSSNTMSVTGHRSLDTIRHGPRTVSYTMRHQSTFQFRDLQLSWCNWIKRIIIKFIINRKSCSSSKPHRRVSFAISHFNSALSACMFVVTYKTEGALDDGRDDIILVESDVGAMMICLFIVYHLPAQSLLLLLGLWYKRQSYNFYSSG